MKNGVVVVRFFNILLAWMQLTDTLVFSNLSDVGLLSLDSDAYKSVLSTFQACYFLPFCKLLVSLLSGELSLSRAPYCTVEPDMV